MEEAFREDPCTPKPCIAIETYGDSPKTYWFPSIKDLADAYFTNATRVKRAIEDGRPINEYGVYVDFAVEEE